MSDRVESNTTCTIWELWALSKSDKKTFVPFEYRQGYGDP